MKKEGRGEFQMKYMGIILFPYISIFFPAFSFSFKTNFGDHIECYGKVWGQRVE